MSIADKIKANNIKEFSGQIVDIFEDYLADKNISLVSEERDDAIADGDDGAAILFGDLYDCIADAVEFAVDLDSGAAEIQLAAIMGFAEALRMGKYEGGVPASDLIALNDKVLETVGNWLSVEAN